MNENTNPELKEEIKEETKKEEKPKKETRQEKKEREKKEREKLEYKVEQPEEEKKPKEPIPKEDYIWYIGAFIFLILAILPLILQNTEQYYDIEREKREESAKTESENNVATETLNCNKMFEAPTYSYTVSITSTYQNKTVQRTIITYKIEQSGTSDSILEAPEEYSTLSNITAEDGAITNVENNNEYKITINYDIDNSLRNNMQLDNHSKQIDEQRAAYIAMNYTCRS